MAQTAPVPTAVIVHTPELVQAPGTNAVLYAQVYDQYGDPMAGQTVQFDIRGSSDNNFQNVMTRYGGPSGDGGLVSMVYSRGSDSEDIILIKPTGSIVPGVQTTAAAKVTFSSAASPVSNVGQPAQRVYVANKNPQPLNAGQFAGFQVNVFDASNHPVNGTLVTFRAVGVNSYTTSGYTNSNGEVHFGYVGSSPGGDVVTATVALGAPGGAVQTWIPAVPEIPDACDLDSSDCNPVPNNCELDPSDCNPLTMCAPIDPVECAPLPPDVCEPFQGLLCAPNPGGSDCDPHVDYERQAYVWVGRPNAGDYCPGTVYKDVFYTYGGNDYVYGYDDRDEMHLGSGSDNAWGGIDEDFIYAGYGHDDVDGQNGADEIHLYGGDDAADGGLGEDVIFGDEDPVNGGSDVIHGGDGADLIKMMGGDYDRAYGGDGNDVIQGHAGRDEAWGGYGNDSFDDAGPYPNDGDQFFGGYGSDSGAINDGDTQDAWFGEQGDDVNCPAIDTGGLHSDTVNMGADEDEVGRYCNSDGSGWPSLEALPL